MIHLTPELRDALAAEYVLGTQTRLVRQRLTRLIEEDAELAELVAWWHTELAPLSEMIEPVPTPPWIWRRIENILQPAEEEPGGGWWSNLMVWRWSTGLAAALALLLVLIQPPAPPPEVPVEGGVVLVLTDDASKPAFLVSRQSTDAPLKAQALDLAALTPEQVYELWLLIPDEAPLSLGLLNDQGSTLLQPSDELNRLVRPGLALAVSLEPSGGSPTGVPTGPVLFVGNIQSL